MSNKSVAIVGYGAVGKGIHKLFPDAVVYDAPLEIGSKAAVNACEYAFVCVPTPMRKDGFCDTSIVERVVSWIESDLIVIRSTVAVGTTEHLARETKKRVVFQPEFGPGETPDHHFNDLRSIRWVILGGMPRDTNSVADLYKTVFNAELRIHKTDARTAELTKYMENAFLAVKVTFCNEFYDLAGAMGIDYDELRELWLLDPRMGRSHTFVLSDNRGFGGRCLPKDVTAIVRTAEQVGYNPILLQAALAANATFRSNAAANGSRESTFAPNGNGKLLGVIGTEATVGQ